MDLFGNIVVWFMVVFIIERYIGVCYFMRGKVWCIVGKVKIFLFFVFGIFLVNMFLEFFEMEIIEFYSNNMMIFFCE